MAGVLRALVLAVEVLERWVARLLLLLGRRVRVHGFVGYGIEGQVQVGGRVLVGTPPRPSTVQRAGRAAAVRANLLPFLTMEVAGALVRVDVAGQQHLVTANPEGYVQALVRDVRLDPGEHRVTLTPVAPPGAPATAVVHVLDPNTDLAVISDIDDTVIDSGIAHGVVATLSTVLLREQATRVPLAGAPELYRALAQRPAGSAGRPFFYVSTSPWNLQDFLVGFLARHGFPPGPLVLTDWGLSAESPFRVSSRTHKLAAMRRAADALPNARFVLIGDSGQQDPEIYAEFCRDHPGRVAAVCIREAGRPGAATAARTTGTVELLAATGVPFVVTAHSARMLDHVREQGLLAQP